MNKLMLVRLVFVILALLLTVLLLREMEIDACLDAGGAFDYATRSCTTLPEVEYVPLLKREVWYRPVLFVGFVSAVVTVLLYKVLIWLLPASWTNGHGASSGAI